MVRLYIYALLQLLLTASVHGQGAHLDIKIPERRDTDLTGRVMSVDTRVSVNVSGQFERKYQEYDRDGNLLIETEWDSDGKCINSLTNYYDDTGTFVRQLFMDYEDGFTNDWEVIFNPGTRQIAMKEKGGRAAVYTYSPEKYLIQFRYLGADNELRSASYTRRDENNRASEFTQMDERKKPLYTFWFKWRDDGVIDRERQRYRQEDGERLHVYDYLETDSLGNWTQRLMVRYDIGGREKEKVYERLVTRTIRYFDMEETAGAELAGDASTQALSAVTSSNEVFTSSVSSPADAADDSGVEPEKENAEPLTADTQDFDYTFDDISDKLVIINCKSDNGRSAGSGFIAKLNGRTYLLTNQHVIMGSDTIRLRTANGESLTPRMVELSQSRDIARIRIDDREGFELSRDIAKGIPVGVFGNSEGAGVATELFGEVTDLGADLVEITAEFVSGNSGSPVLNRNQDVIGIASFVRILWEPPEEGEESGENEDKEVELESKTRRFCYRLTDLQWKPVKWRQYNKEYGKLYLDCKTLSESVFNIIAIWANAPTERIPYSDDMPYDITDWVKEHNGIIDRLERRDYGYMNKFITAYYRSLEQLSETCASRSRRAKMFSSQRDLTGFMEDEFKKQAWSLEYASIWIQAIADNMKEKYTQ